MRVRDLAELIGGGNRRYPDNKDQDSLDINI
jgi:hypothetical protein